MADRPAGGPVEVQSRAEGPQPTATSGVLARTICPTCLGTPTDKSPVIASTGHTEARRDAGLLCDLREIMIYGSVN